MPQVDKATFLPIVFWTFVIYILGFLYLNTSTLFTFLSDVKLGGKRVFTKSNLTDASSGSFGSVLFFPLVGL